ncbi:MAG: hypothetical protein HOO19_08975, partial [Rhodospirillaceae bacterium]|nr:hypothetical protein [Rhodospirillaceae bacterium]
MSADTAETFTAGTQVSILLPLPLGSAYDYRVPNGMRLAVGDFVRVPLGPRTASGVVWGPGKGDIDAAKVKEV